MKPRYRIFHGVVWLLLGCNRTVEPSSKEGEDHLQTHSSHSPTTLSHPSQNPASALTAFAATLHPPSSAELESDAGRADPLASADASTPILPPEFVGSWTMGQTTYYSILGVSSPSPVSGRSLCLTIEVDGRFTAQLGEYGLGAGFSPCGRHANCTLFGRIAPSDDNWEFTEERFSCKMRYALPVRYQGTMVLKKKILALNLRGRGMWGSLQSFGLIKRASCPPHPVAYPACQRRPSRPGSDRPDLAF